jgi:signal transduction histidine kinase
VLVVEDNLDTNEFICRTLAREHAVEAAFDGDEGYRRAKARTPDLVVTDVMMPRVSGEELIEKMRATRELADVPVLVLAARADEEFRARLLRSGAQDYLAKPFLADELRARAANLVALRSARKLLEREVRIARVEQEQAERSSHIKTDFLNLVTHELKNPLTAIKLQVDMLTQDPQLALSGPQAVWAKRLVASTARLTELVESVLQYARIESGKVVVSTRTVLLDALARDVVEEMAAQADAKQLRLELAVDPQLAPLRSDPDLVRLIVSNLVANAIKFTSEGRVTIHLDELHAARRIRVEDTGPGIAAPFHREIFEPFRHIEPTPKRTTKGTGLGLAMVRQLVATLHGRVELESEVGRGTVFSVTLPDLDAPPRLEAASAPQPL